MPPKRPDGEHDDDDRRDDRGASASGPTHQPVATAAMPTAIAAGHGGAARG